MADDSTGTAEAQAATGAESQADTSKQSGSSSQADAAKVQAAEPMTLEEARKLRKESQGLRKRLEEAEAKLKAADDAKLSETERLQQRLKDLEERESRWASERRERDARDAVIEAASGEKVGARNPRAVYRLVKDDLEWDADGNLTNLDAVLKQAKTDYPELFGRAVGSGDGGAGSRQQQGAFDMNAMIRASAGRGVRS